MINYCCSRCGEKVPVNNSYRVDVNITDCVTNSDAIEMSRRRRTKSYILCLACSVELESWMEEDEKEENTNEHD